MGNRCWTQTGKLCSEYDDVEREDFDRLSTLAKKYVTAEKKESKLQKAVDAANKLIAKLKAEIDSLKQEISDYKSVHSKLRTAELERENT